MNKRQITASLSKIANELDNDGHFTEANTVTNVMMRIADEFDIKDDNTDEPANEPANEPKTKPKMKSKPETKDSAVLKKVLDEFERKVDDICANSKDAKSAMILMSNQYYRGLIYIIDYSSPKERTKFGNRAMDIMNDCLKKYNLISN
jgi:hypothetical protein